METENFTECSDEKCTRRAVMMTEYYEPACSKHYFLMVAQAQRAAQLRMEQHISQLYEEKGLCGKYFTTYERAYRCPKIANHVGDCDD